MHDANMFVYLLLQGKSIDIPLQNIAHPPDLTRAPDTLQLNVKRRFMKRQDKHGSKSMNFFTGVWPALVTPFDAKGRVNLDAIQRLVEALIEAGVDGFYTCGATGEGLLLSPAERKQVMAAVVAQSAGRVPVIAHVGALTTAEAVDLATHAAAHGAAAVAAIPPSFYTVDIEGLRDYYRAIAEAADALPLYIYYLPARTGVTMTVDVVRDLMGIEQLRGVKFTSSDLYLMERLLQLGINILSGPDEMFLACLATGAHGAIGTTVNILPHRFAALYAAFNADDRVRARQLQGEINAVITALVATGNLVGATKAVLQMQGIDCGPPRRPLLPLSATAYDELRAALGALGVLP